METIKILLIAAGLLSLCGCQWLNPNGGKTVETPAPPPATGKTEYPRDEYFENAFDESPDVSLAAWVNAQALSRELRAAAAPPSPPPSAPEPVAAPPEAPPPVVPVPEAVPAAPVPPPVAVVAPVEVPGGKRYALGVVGAIEPVYVLPFKSPFSARIDTGAATSSLDARNIKLFERDGQRWVSFDIEQRDTGETQHYKRRVARRLRITRTNAFERRVSVMMSVRLGKEIIQAEFSLNDRNDFDYPVLIGRNILAGLAVVDVNMKNTLK